MKASHSPGSRRALRHAMPTIARQCEKCLSIVAILGGMSALAPASGAAGNPVAGWWPMVQAGLDLPKKNASASVSLNGSMVAMVTCSSPDASVWLANGVNLVRASPVRRVSDDNVFDASLAFAEQPNVCIPDTRSNTFDGDVAFGQSFKSYATVVPDCAFDPRVDRAQAFVSLFDVISAASGVVSTGNYVRDGVMALASSLSDRMQNARGFTRRRHSSFST